jgi:hypothetical protein
MGKGIIVGPERWIAKENSLRDKRKRRLSSQDKYVSSVLYFLSNKFV